MKLEEIMLSGYPETDKELVKKIQKLEKRLKKLGELIAATRQECNHPKEFIVIKDHGGEVSDGYGGSNWVNRGFQASCTLCKKYNVGMLRVEGNKVEGTQPHVENYKIQKLRERELEHQRRKRIEEDEEKRLYNRLKAKYENKPGARGKA